jgi:agmatine deiminase
MPRSTSTTEQRPAALGFAMPAEWEKHSATWLGWPHNPTDWPDKLDTIRWVYGEMVRKISAGETVCLLVGSKAEEKLARRYLTRAGADVSRVEFIVHATNRGWMRDSGPVFVKRAKGKRETAIVHFHFNAWAKYEDWQKDRRVPEIAAKHLGKRLFDAQAGGRKFVLEGGGIDVNGRGSLLTTEECYLSPEIQVRNPGLSKDGFEAALREYLGATNVLWLAGGVVGDDTHGRVRWCSFARTIARTSTTGRSRRTGNACRTSGWRMVRNPRWSRCPCRNRSPSMAIACPPATPTSTSRMRP